MTDKAQGGEETRGVVARGDPASRLRVGEELRFGPRLFPNDLPQGHHPLSNWTDFEGVILQQMIIGKNLQRVYIPGCAVTIAPGIALAAKHTIEDYLEDLTVGKLTLALSAICTYGLQLWHCTSAQMIPDTDLTILYVSLGSELPPNNAFLQAALTTRVPKIGDECSIVGFVAVGDGNFERSEIYGQFFASKGNITDVFLDGRARIYPGPSFGLWCHSIGGMSGGAVFTRDGYLVGLLSTSIESEDKNGPSFISLLWPALTSQTNATWPNGVHNAGEYLYLKSTLCLDERHKIRANEDGRLQILK